MLPRQCGLLLSVWLFLTTPLAANEWSFGTVADATTGLSLQYKRKTETAVHLSAQFFAEEVFALEADWQSFYTPPYDWRPIQYRLYSGIGLLGKAQQEDPLRENYSIAIPIGVQWNPQGLPLELFAEASALLGALPTTGLKGRARGGLRAVF